MANHADEHKPDNRKPHEIARAILEHHLLSLRGSNFEHYLKTEMGPDHGIPHGPALLKILRKIRDQKPLTQMEEMSFRKHTLTVMEKAMKDMADIINKMSGGLDYDALIQATDTLSELQTGIISNCVIVFKTLSDIRNDLVILSKAMRLELIESALGK